jgi:hypothetical protein
METCWEHTEKQIENLKSMMGRSLGTCGRIHEELSGNTKIQQKKTSPTTSSFEGSKMDIFGA